MFLAHDVSDIGEYAQFRGFSASKIGSTSPFALIYARFGSKMTDSNV